MEEPFPPPRDPSPIRMADEAEPSLLPSPMEITALPVDGRGQKENLCSISEVEDESTLSSSLWRETTPLMLKSRDTKAANLRKSLAWNQAFFTEEGVLNPLELSILSGSLTKSSGKGKGKVSAGINAEIVSPLTMYNKCSVRPPLHDVEENLCTKVHTMSQIKDSKVKKVEPQVHLAPGKIPSTKNMIRSVPRSPASYSQKRAANVNTTNPTSKIPKVMPSKSLASSPAMTSRNVLLSSKSSTSEQSGTKVDAGKCVGLRGSPVRNKLYSGLSSSLGKVSANDHGKTMTLKVEKASACPKVISDSSYSTKVHKPVACASSGQLGSSIPQNTHLVCGGPPPLVHARPSALRMPSPSLGFFQGKASPHNNQHQRNTQPPKCKIPSLSKQTDLRQVNELRLPTTTWQQPTSVFSAAKSSAETVLCNSSQNCLAADCLNVPLISDTHPPVNEKDMEISDLMKRRNSTICGSLHSQRNGEEQSNNNCLVATPNFDKQSQELSSGNPNPEKVIIPYNDSTISQLSSESSVEDSEYISHLETIVPHNIYDSFPPTGDSNGNEALCPNFSSKTCFRRELHRNSSMESQVGEFGTDTVMTENSLVEDTRDKTHAVKSERKEPAQNSDVISDLDSGLSVKIIDDAACIEDEASFGQRKEQMTDTEVDSNLELDKSLIEMPGISYQTAQGSDYVGSEGSSFLKECQPSLLENREPQDSRLQCELKKSINSANMDEVMTENVISTDKLNKEGVPSKWQLNAVPFSDEWLAALEAFGEEILEKKTGPVQNSPPDKALPEPSPWSPVKKKAQDIGPFDCTKYAKSLSTSDTN